jgi:Flp pilus assembly protein TadD
MATRVAFPSLRGRFKWIVACTVAIALISIVSIALYYSPQPANDQVATDRAVKPANEIPADPEPAKVDDAPSGEKSRPARNQATVANYTAEAAVKPAGDFTSRYGYKVSFAGTDWKHWDNLPQLVPAAEFGALYKNTGRFLVVPVPLGDLDPRPEALDHALLACMGIGYPSDQIANFVQFELDGADGQRFHVRLDVNGKPIDYRICVLRRGNCAYLAAAWLDRSASKESGKDTNDLSLLDDALNRLSLEAKTASELKNTALNPAQRQALANIYNDLGLSAYNARDFAAAVDSFRLAFELQPKDPAILTNLINSRIELTQYREALAELDLNLDRFANQPDLFAARAFLLSELGETDAALRAYKTLFSTGYFAEPPFTQYVTLLAGAGQLDEALAAVNGLLQTRESFAIRRLQASLLRRKGDNQQAAAILQQVSINRPFSAELAYDLADSLRACERFEEALEVCSELLAHRYDTAHTYLLQAKNQFGLQWYAEAKKSLMTALKREPANKDAQDLLALVSSTLGEGNNSAIQEEIEPVPAASSSRRQAANKPADADGGAYYTDRAIAISFIPNQEFKQTERRTLRVLDASGVVRFSTIQVSFDPVAEKLFVNSLKVIDADGKLFGAGKPSDYYVVDASRNDVATQNKTLNIPVPGLQPNCTVELVITRQNVGAPPAFPYFAHYFSSGIPVRTASLFVRTNPELIKFENTAEVQLERTADGFLFSIDNPPLQRSEVLPAARSSYLPHVQIGSPAATWKQLSEEYLASIADRLLADEVVSNLAKECTAGAKDDDAKAATVIRFVQDRLTYKAIEFGRRARVPNRAAEIAQNKYGDCKDHALLLVQLLRACNIPAELALANLEETVDPKFAAFDQFNHMLVYLPTFRGGRAIDCSDKDCDLPSLTVPTDLAGAQILVLDSKDPRFVQLPEYPEYSSKIDVARTVRISGETDAAVEETVTVTGYHAAFLRNMFKGVAVPERAVLLQRELSPLGGAMQVQSLEIDNLENREQPLVFRASYLVRGRFRNADSLLLGELPALWERMYLDVPPLANRRTPFEIEYPLDFVSAIDFTAPSEFTVRPPDKADTSGKSSFANWQLHTAPTKNGLRITYNLHLPAGRHAASEYSAYDEAMEAAVSGLTQNVTLMRGK